VNLNVTYAAKMSCDNCGMFDFYTIPRGKELMSFYNQTYGEPTFNDEFSGIRDGIGNFDSQRKVLNCHNCRMPFLILERWTKDELAEKKQAVTR
jgi:hypothetical protein